MIEYRTTSVRRFRRIGFALTMVLIAASVRPGRADTPPFATYRLDAGAATFGVVLPQGAAVGGVLVGLLPTQTDVKNRWPDGSIKFAVVSANIPSLGSYPLTASAPSAGLFTPTWPTIVLSLVIGGTTWTATPGPFTAVDPWLAGPVVREARVKATPTNGGVPHPQLEVVFDIRSYAGGGHRIDVTVQNVRDAVSMDKVLASSVALSVNGSPVWTHGPVTTYSMTRWRHVEWFGATESLITPDFEPTFRAGALPRVPSTVISPTYDFSGPNYDLMGGPPPGGYPVIAYGEMLPDMAAGGGRREIGALVQWDAVYLAHKTQNQRTAVLRNADLTGAWSNHLAKPDGTFIKLGDAGYDPTTWWWDARSSSGDRPLAALNVKTNWQGAREGLSPDTDTGALNMPSRYDNEHVPAPMYVAYLLSGDRYYVDQAKFWATCAILKAFPTWQEGDKVNFPGWMGGRNGATGNERLLASGGLNREFAWPLRLVAYTAWIIPDTDADRSYFMTTVQNNLNYAGNYLDLWVRLGYGGALGAIGGAENASWTLTRLGEVTGRFSATWSMAYTAYVVDWATRQGIWTITPSVDGFVNRVVNLAIAMNVQNPEFLTGNAGLSYQYYPVYNTMSGGRFTRWFDTFAELRTFNETYLYQDDPVVGNKSGWNPKAPETGYYNTEHHLVLQIGVRRGLPNALTAAGRLARVKGHLDDLNTRAQFAITFSDAVSPAPPAPTGVRIVP